MKYYVNENCIGCGLCASVCPDFFEMTDAGTAKAADRESINNEGAEALAGCPTDAIKEID